MNETWDAMFGKEFYIELRNSERKYFGLNEIVTPEDTTTFYSKTNFWYKRTTLFWKAETVVKVIVEENCVIKDGTINFRSYCEFDTEIHTENREMVLPLTNRGKKKKLSATNIINIMPFGCTFYFYIDSAYEREHVHLSACNQRSNQRLAIGEQERINKIRNAHDFREFVEYFIATCPDDYFERVNLMKTSKHITVKYRVGDIFRIELDRFNYCYGLIIGEAKKIQKWPELPERHSLRNIMMVPLMIRIYDIVTSDKNLTTTQLKDVPLGNMRLCGDNDIIWGIHPIVSHKELEPEDIHFNFVCTKYYNEDRRCTVFTQDFLTSSNIISTPKKYNLYLEWGTAATTLSYSQLSDKLRDYLSDYRSPYGGVSMGISPDKYAVSDEEFKNSAIYKYDIFKEHNSELRLELFSCLGLPADATFDDFAKMYGGLTKAEIVKKIN